jgi:hypothetical protein
MRNQLQKANFLYVTAILLLTTSIAFCHVRKAVDSIPPKPKFSDFMGINFHTTLVHDPRLYAQTCRLARDYHPVSWDVWNTSNGSTKFPDTPYSQNGVNWDQLYGNWMNAGYTINASLMDLEKYVNSIPNNCFSADVMNELQAYGTKFARSFGPGGKWPRVQMAEIENEPFESSDNQYKSLFKALATGLRLGDAQLKILTCAVTADMPSPSIYEKSIQILDRDTNLFDIISMHTYALKSGYPSWENSYPEDPKIDYLSKIDRMIAYKKLQPSMANKPIWITEFGFDAGTLLAQRKNRLWKSSTETEQAQWIVRSFLVFSEKDVERAYVYWFEDDDSGNLHGASGIVRRNSAGTTHTPKPSFYSMRHLFNALGSYRFKRVVTKQQAGVYTFEYANDANQLAWVVWSPTEQKADSSVTLTNLPTSQVRIEKLTLADGPVTSTTTSAPGNTLNIMVSETPKFLFFLPDTGPVTRRTTPPEQRMYSPSWIPDNMRLSLDEIYTHK